MAAIGDLHGEDCRHHGGRIAMVGGVRNPLAAAAADT